MLSSEPADVVATKDALIHSVAAMQGQAAVRQGQTVKKGQTLISGSVLHEGKEPRYVHARGDVIGRVWYSETVIESVYDQMRTRTGRQSSIRWLCIGNWKIVIENGQEFAQQDTEMSETYLSNSWFPVKIVEQKCFEVSVAVKPKDQAELKKQMERQAMEKALSQKSYRGIYGMDTVFTELEGGLLKAEINLEVLESIGKTVPLQKAAQEE